MTTQCYLCGKNVSFTSQSLDKPICFDCRRTDPEHIEARKAKRRATRKAWYWRDEAYRERQRKTNRDGNRERYHTDPVYHDYALANSHARRADKLGVEDITTRLDLVAFLMERDKGICQLCLTPIEDRQFEKYDPGMPSIDHVIPLARGGTHALNNLQLAHLQCNWSKGDRESAQTVYSA